MSESGRTAPLATLRVGQNKIAGSRVSSAAKSLWQRCDWCRANQSVWAAR